MKTQLTSRHYSAFVGMLYPEGEGIVTRENVLEYLHALSDRDLYYLCVEFPELQTYLVDMITSGFDLVLLLDWWHQNPDKCCVDVDVIIERICVGSAVSNLFRLWKKIAKDTNDTSEATPVYLALRRHIPDLMDRMVVCSAIVQSFKSSPISKTRRRPYCWMHHRNLSTSELFNCIFSFFIKDAEILVPRIQEVDIHWLRKMSLPDQLEKYSIPSHIVRLCYDYFQQFELDAKEVAFLAKIPGAKDDMIARIHTANDALMFLRQFRDEEASYLSEFIDVIVTDPDRQLVSFILFYKGWSHPELLIDTFIDRACAARWRIKFPSDAPIMSLRSRYATRRNRI